MSTMRSTSGVSQQQLIDAYLADLKRSLRDKDPDEAAEIEESVREHVDAALAGPGSPTIDQVQAVLADLGPVERIAALATDTPVDAGRARFVAPVLVVVLGMLGVAAAGFWFLSVPLGLAATVGGVVFQRRSLGTIRTLHQVGVVLGVVALMASLLIAFFFVEVTSG